MIRWETRALVWATVLSLGIVVWAAVQGIWVPLLILIPMVVAVVPWGARILDKSNAGYFIWCASFMGLWYGTVNYATGDRPHTALYRGLFFGLTMGFVFMVQRIRNQRKEHVQSSVRDL